MKRQSVATGAVPLLTGWLQSPFAARATLGASSSQPNSNAATAGIARFRFS
jgi:hypothetical protein